MKVFFLGLFLGSAVVGLFFLFILKKQRNIIIQKNQSKIEQAKNEIELAYLKSIQEKDKEIANLKTLVKQQAKEIKNIKLKNKEKSNSIQVTEDKTQITLVTTIQNKDTEVGELRKLINQINNLTQDSPKALNSLVINNSMENFSIEAHQSNLLNQDFSPSENLPEKYQQLQQYLIDKEWQSADQETSKILFDLSGSSQTYLNITDYQKLPLKELAIIDGLWSYYSNGLFGLSAQYKIYSGICTSDNISPNQWQKIGDLLGWRRNQQWVSSNQNLTISLDAPNGQFPFLMYWQGVWLGGFMEGQSNRFIALISRFTNTFL